MTDHTKSAGDVEARDTLRSEIAHIVASTVAGTCCRKTGGKGGDNARPDCECLAASSDIMMKLDAYLAKLTSTKVDYSNGDIAAREALNEDAVPWHLWHRSLQMIENDMRDNASRDPFQTPTKAEPSRIADRRPDIFAVNVGNDGRVRIVDLCYTAFMRRANGKNDEDGGPCDWFNDTYPQIVKGIEAMAAEHRARITAIEADKATLSQKVRELVTALDQNFGTPCEQIRHQQEVEELEAENVALREDVQRTERENDEAYELGKADGRGAQTQEIDIATGGDGEYRWSDDPERCVESHGKMKANIVARFRAIEADRERLTKALMAAARYVTAYVYDMNNHPQARQNADELNTQINLLLLPPSQSEGEE